MCMYTIISYPGAMRLTTSGRLMALASLKFALVLGLQIPKEYNRQFEDC
jgi:hypothetical protein